MKIETLLNRIDIIPDNREYWLVRTDKGKLFDEYINGNFISLGWDYLTVDQIQTLSEDEIKNKIAINENFDSTKTEDKIKITSSYNKLKIFLSLKKNDIILIPGKNSDRIAIGKIIDEQVYEEKAKLDEGSFFKRRKVEWISIKNIRDLNPIFYQIKSNQHSISNVNRFEPYINRVIENLYIKDDYTHFVLKIEKDEDINFDDLNKLLKNINFLIKEINKDFKFEENIDDFYIKINLQSKGAIEFIKGGKSLAVLGLILSFVSCDTNNNQSDKEITTYISENQNIIDETQQILDSLEVNKSELSKIAQNGK